MSRAAQTWIIVAALFVSVSAIILFSRHGEAASAMAEPNPQPSQMTIPDAPLPIPSKAERTEVIATPEAQLSSRPQPFTEKINDTSLTFMPEGEGRRLIEFKKPTTTKDEDGTCSTPYTAREKVSKVTYAYGFVIDRFNTWNDKEGQQEYMPFESELPRSFQGSLHDIVREGSNVTITKQRCGMGQVEFLVSVKP